MRIDVYVHVDFQSDPRIDQILTILTKQEKEIQNLSPELQTLSDQVTANTGVIASAKTLISGFSARLDAAIEAAAKGDTAALPALSAELKTADDDLAAAVAANTPAAPGTGGGAGIP